MPRTELRELLGERYDEVIERAARAAGDGDDDCFAVMDAWNARPDWERTDSAAWDESIGSAEEGVAYWRSVVESTLPAVLPDLLAAVLPDLLADARREGQADAWDEGHEAGWDDLAAREAEPDLTDTPNPYRTEETDHA